MRLACFSPLPPVRSGIAAYAAELLPRLAERHTIELFCDTPPGATPPFGAFPTFSAHDYVWKQARAPYDLTVYQLGNAPCHDYLWPYLARYPGLVVLHDGQLHHARARALLDAGRADRYRTEFAYAHPDAPPAIADLGAQRLLGQLMYVWPMRRLPIEAARTVAVHNAWLADTLRREHPAAAIEVVRMGVGDPLADRDPGAVRARGRARFGFGAGDLVFAAVGGLTPEKGLPQILRALGAITDTAPTARLLLVGAAARHYDVLADARAHGVADRVVQAGYVDDADLGPCLAAADVCLCLRWPTGRETSASWLRCLAAGRPTVITDLAHTGHVPALITRGDWTPSQVGQVEDGPIDGGAGAGPAGPVTVAIDLLDKDRSLALAMRRLAADPALRRDLGARARAWWRTHHRLDTMAADYHRVIAAAATRAARPLPAYLQPDGSDRARALLDPFGVASDLLAPDGR